MNFVRWAEPSEAQADTEPACVGTARSRLRPPYTTASIHRISYNDGRSRDSRQANSFAAVSAGADFKHAFRVARVLLALFI
jgi:hypothetical protein